MHNLKECSSYICLYVELSLRYKYFKSTKLYAACYYFYLKKHMYAYTYARMHFIYTETVSGDLQ